MQQLRTTVCHINGDLRSQSKNYQSKAAASSLIKNVLGLIATPPFYPSCYNHTPENNMVR